MPRLMVSWPLFKMIVSQSLRAEPLKWRLRGPNEDLVLRLGYCTHHSRQDWMLFFHVFRSPGLGNTPLSA